MDHSLMGIAGASIVAAKRSKAELKNDYPKFVDRLDRIAALLDQRLKEREDERRGQSRLSVR